MCLFKVRQEEDVVVPYRVARHRSPSPTRVRRSSQRVSRTEVIRESRPTSSSYIARPPSASYVAVPTPKPLAIPAPQPVPVFVQPSPPPPPPPAAPSHISSHHHAPHYVQVSPSSSVTSHSPNRSEYVMREREYRRERRERDYSPESPRYEHFRYVEAAPERDERYERYSRRERSRSRARSRDRDHGYDLGGGDSYRETRERVVITDDDGRRRREYRR